jgi:hypothetical protein
MSYQAIDLLSQDAIFGGRIRACTVEQAESFKNDARPDWVAVAKACLTGDGTITNAFTRLSASGPGIGNKVDNGDGTIEQANVTDQDILALTQANWPTVANLYYNEDGTPIGG